MVRGFRRGRGSEHGGPNSGMGRYGGPRDEERGGTRIFRKKVCRFCSQKAPLLDYKANELLQRFLTEKGKIMPRRITGVCSKHQRRLAAAIKRSRHSGLLAFQVE